MLAGVSGAGIRQRLPFSDSVPTQPEARPSLRRGRSEGGFKTQGQAEGSCGCGCSGRAQGGAEPILPS